MEKKLINPWQWQDGFGYSQAVEVIQPTRTLYLAGQTAMSAEGRPSEGDMASQVADTLENIEAVLTEAGYAWGDVVRLNVYTTSSSELLANFGQVVGKLAGNRPASTLLEISALAFPSLKVEIEVTAAQ